MKPRVIVACIIVVVEKNGWKVILDCCLNAKTYSSFALSISFLICAYLFYFCVAVLRFFLSIFLYLPSFSFSCRLSSPSVNIKDERREEKKKKENFVETSKAMELSMGVRVTSAKEIDRNNVN